MLNMDSEKSTPAPTHPEIPPTDDRVRHRVDSTGQVFAVFSGGLFINVSTGETGRLAPEDLAAMKPLPRQAEYILSARLVRAL